MEFTHEENLLYLKEEREMLIKLKNDCAKLGRGTILDSNVIATCESMVNTIDNHIDEAVDRYDISYELRMCMALATKFMLVPMLMKQRTELMQELFELWKGAN